MPVTDALVRTVAQLRFDCRSIGHPIAAAPHHSDLWIAATAIHIGAQLVTDDSVFQTVPGMVRAG